ncbi:MAG TPA: PAN domain-containing protein [Xanthobacteraceae bacterium]|nr:PAN domain-containing protein [Xanthobacteraceae bacterium]
MPGPSSRLRASVTARWALCLAFWLPFLAPVLAPARAGAELLSLADLSRDKIVSRQQCFATPQAVFVTAMGRGYCVRYYLSTAGGEGVRPVVFLQGDMPCRVNLMTMTCTFDHGWIDVRTEDLQRYADNISRQQKTTAIYLARVGRDGSSGSHALRHTMNELLIANAALDAIKQRYGFEGFHLYGHSGGSMMVEGLVGLRQDIGCAVAADGSVRLGRRIHPVPPGVRFPDADLLTAIIHNPEAKLIIVTDPEDRIVSGADQEAFLTKLRQAGRQADQYFVEAPDDEHHFTTPHAALVMRGCISGESHERIATELTDYVARDLMRKVAKAATNIGDEARARTVDEARARAAGSAAMSNIELRGLDYASIQPRSSDPAACQDACRADPRCAAWTFVKASVPGAQARCWLKSAVPHASANACCTSGVERPAPIATSAASPPAMPFAGARR